MLINMMAEDGTTTESIRRRTRSYRNRVRSALRDCLDRAAECGEALAGDVDERANLLLGLVLGFNIAARGGASRAELKGLLGAVNAQVEAWRVQ